MEKRMGMSVAVVAVVAVWLGVSRFAMRRIGGGTPFGEGGKAMKKVLWLLAAGVGILALAYAAPAPAAVTYTYDSNTPENASWPDGSSALDYTGTELTDGTTPADYSAAGFAGFKPGYKPGGQPDYSNPIVNFDLGGSTQVNAIKVWYSHVYCPDKVYITLANNADYSDGTATLYTYGYTGSGNAADWYNFLGGTGSGWFIVDVPDNTYKYAKLDVRKTNGDWVFLGDVQFTATNPPAYTAPSSIHYTYYSNTQPGAAYPDSPRPDGYAYELVDGAHATTSLVGDAAWAGFATTGGPTSASKPYITFDLGSSQDIKSITIGHSGALTGGVYAPDSVYMSFSSDNVSWSTPELFHGVFNRSSGPHTTTVDVTDVTAHYARLDFRAVNPWMFLDEVTFNNTNPAPPPAPDPKIIPYGNITYSYAAVGTQPWGAHPDGANKLSNGIYTSASDYADLQSVEFVPYHTLTNPSGLPYTTITFDLGKAYKLGSILIDYTSTLQSGNPSAPGYVEIWADNNADPTTSIGSFGSFTYGVGANSQKTIDLSSYLAAGGRYLKLRVHTYSDVLGSNIFYLGEVTFKIGDLALGSGQTFDAGGINYTVGDVTLTGGSITNGTITGMSYSLSSGTVSAVLAGSGIGLSKITTGLVTLSNTNSYTGATLVSNGTLKVDGSIAASTGVSITAGATLAGSGIVPIISGDGLVSPGSSPGILTTTQVDPGTGLDFAFEFTVAGSPDYGAPTDSDNDVLRITHAATPFLSALDTDNVVDIYFDLASIASGDIFKGAWYTDLSSDFYSFIQSAGFNYYVLSDGSKGAPDTTFNGVNYYTLGKYNSALSILVSTVNEASTQFGGKDGFVTQFEVQGGTVPEPAALGLLGFVLLAIRRRRSL